MGSYNLFLINKQVSDSFLPQIIFTTKLGAPEKSRTPNLQIRNLLPTHYTLVHIGIAVKIIS